MNTEIAKTQDKSALIESVLIGGDLSKLTSEQRTTYYLRVCDSVNLNHLTKPFEYITLNNKLVLYAKRDATDQLRSIHNVSVEDISTTEREGVFIVTAKVRNAAGRTDVSTGAVNISGLKGNDLANALMKAETKAKRRATLSICGLGFVMDETELETVRKDTSGLTGELTAKEAYGSVKLMKEKFTEIAKKINDCKEDEELTKVFTSYKIDFNNFRAIDETLFENLCQLGQNRRDLLNDNIEHEESEVDKDMLRASGLIPKVGV